ncbi:hypothetical protein [Neptuniibacter caesariensis]|uniref:Lipoprotein n=1 Tax=Neptuniibacter caesariensis TaxID=207954 RepID=A0A7U8GPQ1_NEPCE|nr:hypothetical protein [Neptuniibacter caesariensis]EAR59547.1 hypothetical protein MED92_12229 [Oceanospirillum sp. MED92] [Neptuniibacter caesariensis]
MKKTLLAPLISVVLISGCASFEAPSYSPDYQTIDAVKTQSLKAVSLGDFSPMDPQAKVNKISLRAAGFKAKQGTFTQYFRDALEADLTEIGIYDQASDVTISAELVENDLDISGFSKGKGLMQVRLMINQGEDVLLDKVYTAVTEFDSSFAAAVAVPKAQSEYPVLVKTMLAKIYTDKAFVKAVTKI